MPIAIVTGGNSGIGRATSVLLAERAFDVGLTFHAGGVDVFANNAGGAYASPALPVPRAGHAREIAGMVGFLASPEGTYTTGQSLVVDVGRFLMRPIASRG